MDVRILFLTMNVVIGQKAVLNVIFCCSSDHYFSYGLIFFLLHYCFINQLVPYIHSSAVQSSISTTQAKICILLHSALQLDQLQHNIVFVISFKNKVVPVLLLRKVQNNRKCSLPFKKKKERKENVHR